MKNIGIFTMHEVKAAYSCLFYLKESLEKKYDTHLWAFSKKGEIDEKYRLNYHSFSETWFGKIRRVRVYLSKILFLFKAIKYDVIIINDLDFFHGAYLIKKVYPNKRIVHYNTEISGADVKYPRHTTSFYKKHASFPDMIIECLNERALYRKKTFNIDKKIFTINNTLPAKYVDSVLSKENEEEIPYVEFDNKYPIIVYAGGCNLSRCLGDIISCSSKFEDRANFVFFCYGSQKDFARVQDECKNHLNCKLYPAISKELLLKVMNRCDIGIQYYDPSISVNHYYASPSKLYEYMAAGLNVISSNNEGINHIIVDNKIGVCFDDVKQISTALDELLYKIKKMELCDRDKIKDLFKTKYSYEIDSSQCISQLLQTIDE